MGLYVRAFLAAVGKPLNQAADEIYGTLGESEEHGRLGILKTILFPDGENPVWFFPEKDITGHQFTCCCLNVTLQLVCH